MAITHSDLNKILCFGIQSEIRSKNKINCSFLHFDAVTENFTQTIINKDIRKPQQITYALNEYIANMEVSLQLLLCDTNFLQVRVVSEGIVYIPVNEIVYLQGYGYNTVIGAISGKKYNVQESQKKILERLPQYVTKIHQSYAINRKIVAQIDTNWLVTKTGMSIPLARNEIK